jgi:hypothetical protein
MIPPLDDRVEVRRLGDEGDGNQVDPLLDRELGPGDVALHRSRGQLDVRPRLQLGDVAAQLADPQLRPRQIAEDRHLAPSPLGRCADRLDGARVALAVGLGEVEAEDVGAGLDQAGQHLLVPAGRADGRDDLGPPAMHA